MSRELYLHQSLLLSGLLVVCLIWGLTSLSTLFRSFLRCCFQFCGTFTRHWNEMTSQALSPNETSRVYKHGRSNSHRFAWAGLNPLSSLPVLVCGRFLLCVEASCSPSISPSLHGRGPGLLVGIRNTRREDNDQELIQLPHTYHQSHQRKRKHKHELVN